MVLAVLGAAMSVAQSAPSADVVGTVIKPILPLSEEGLRALDEAAHARPIDDRLLSGTPARDLLQALHDLAAALRALDVGRVLAHTGWWSRLTGADVEARLEFDLACRNLRTLQDAARQRSVAAREAGSLLWSTGREITADQKRLEAVIVACRAAARDPTINLSAPDLLGRFQRRIGNFTTLHTSQVMALKQIDLAIALLTNLLDRHLEIERLVLPIWKHAGMAAAQGLGRDAKLKQTLDDLRKAHAGAVAGADVLLEPKNV